MCVMVNVIPVKPTTIVSQLDYKWSVASKDKDVNWKVPTGSGIVHLPTDAINLDLGHFPFSGEYILELDITSNGESVTQTIVDYDVLRRSEVFINVWWILLAALLSAVATYLGVKLTS